MLQKFHNFPAKYKTDLIIVFVLFVLGLVTRYELSLSVYYFNDIGYHAHIAEMVIERFPWYPPFDPSWRLGILVNYPKLFEYILAGVSSVSGLTIWEAYPYVQLGIWSLIPCSIYFLVSRLHSREAGIVSASFSLYPILNADQSSEMLAMVIFPIIVLSFICLMQEKTFKKAFYFGILLSLLFFSHFLVFTFAVLTFLITIGVVLVYKILKVFLKKERDYFFQIKRVIVPFAIGSGFFTVITSPWWIATLRFYGTNAFRSPLNSLTMEEALLTSGAGMEFFRSYSIVIFPLVLAAIGIIVFKFFSFDLSIKSVDLKNMISILYFSVASIVSICLLFPFSTFNIWYGPPWRYYVFVVFVCWVAAGIFVTKVFNGILQRAKAIQIHTGHRIKMVIPLIFLIFFVIYTTITFHEALSKQELPYPGIPRFPIPRSDANVQAMKWLDNHTSSTDVVVADTAHSTWILYHTDASTLAGHYGTTRPDDSKDRAAAIILASDDYEETVILLKKYSVDYIYVDTTTISGGAFEMMIHWNKLWPRTEPQENIEKLEALTIKVYDREGIKIFKVPEKISARAG